MTYQEIVWNFFKGKNLDEKSIAAIMGNIQAESSFDPSTIEAVNNIGFGLCQWSFGRRTQLEAYGTDINHQLEFLWSELSGENLSTTGADYQWINRYGYLNHTDFMNGEGTIEDLTSSFCFSWERPNESLAHLDVRKLWANNYFAIYGGTLHTLHVKLIHPYWYGSNIKISYLLNRFELINSHGNVYRIKNTESNRYYYVNKSSTKVI